jgi:16S rRNA (cytosine1402-N4)-methyltransferase
MAQPPHVSVLYKETLDYLDVDPQGTYVDATCGAGGHSAGIAELLSGEGRLIAIDRDPVAIRIAKERLAEYGSRVVFKQGTFSEIERILDELTIEKIDGVLADLGVSSIQLDDIDRGFSWNAPGEVDMRMGFDAPRTAAELIRSESAEMLARLLKDYGEQPCSRRVARSIKQAADSEQPLTGARLRDAILSALPAKLKHARRIDPATKVFMALRIAVNDELGELQHFLAALPERLAPNGRAVLISFHSLEDRIVKRFFREQADPCTCPREMPECRCGKVATLKVLTRKPVLSSDAEQEVNPRSRSAKLRAAARLG